MIDRETAVAAAAAWLDAWNAHEPERVVAHFADDVLVSSPVAAQLRPGSEGILRGRAEVLGYYRDGLAGSPGLHFTLVDVCTGTDGYTVVYRNQRETLVTERLTLRADGLASEVHVSYGA